jgi:hypothetical protein
MSGVCNAGFTNWITLVAKLMCFIHTIKAGTRIIYIITVELACITVVTIASKTVQASIITRLTCFVVVAIIGSDA